MPIIAVTLMVFLGTALVLFLLMYIFVPGKTILKERIEGMAHEIEPAYLEHPPSGFEKFLANLGGRIPLNPRDYGKYMKSLVAAGYRREMIPVFMGTKLLLMVALPAAYVFYGIQVGQERMMVIVTALALAIVGFLIPSYWLSRMVRRRQIRIFHDLPDVLDLLTVSVEAGLSMDAAIVRIAGDRQFSNSPLAMELRLATQEVRAGKPREDALRDLGERTMLDDLKSFIAMLIQTERLGTSLADSLRIHSDSFLIMPALFVVMLMPALLRLIKIFSEI
jgi:tight adherence protein C